MVENRTTACKWDTVIPFAPLWEAYKRVIKPNGAIVLFGSQPFTSALVMSNLEWFKYEWIWQKSCATGFIHAKNKPMKKHENVLVFSGGTTVHASQSISRMPYFPQNLTSVNIQEKRTSKSNSSTFFSTRPSHVSQYTRTVGNYPLTIINFPAREQRLHPTQKPVALLEYLIKTYTNEGETVLDSCFGSGTTAIACMRTGRKFIGIEKDADYFEVSCQRVKDEQRQGRLFTV